MRVKCKFSNVEFTVEHFNNLFFIDNQAHPIMSSSIPDLVRLLRPWNNGELSEKEERLLFVAFLKNSNMVRFNIPAIPDRKVIQKNMIALSRLTAWKWNSAYIPTPEYSINESTFTLSNLHFWIEETENARISWMSRKDEYEKKQVLERMERYLYKLIHSREKTTSYATKLGRWVLTVLDIEEKTPKYEEYLRIFRLKDFMDICNAEAETIAALLGEMELEIDASSIQGHVAFRHIRTIAAMNANGVLSAIGGETNLEEIYAREDFNPGSLRDFIGLDDENFNLLGEDSEEDKDESLFEPSVTPSEKMNNEKLKLKKSAAVVSDLLNRGRNPSEIANIKNIVDRAPKEMPKKEDYQTQAAYLKAYAEWRISENEKVRKQEVIDTARKFLEAREKADKLSAPDEIIEVEDFSANSDDFSDIVTENLEGSFHND